MKANIKKKFVMLSKLVNKFFLSKKKNKSFEHTKANALATTRVTRLTPVTEYEIQKNNKP